MIGRAENQWCRTVFHSTDIVPTFSFPNEFFHTFFENRNFVCVPTAIHKGCRIVSVKRSVADRLYERLWTGDRKSTRLNSSHVKISYAVFCLKKKKIKKD